MTRNKQTPIQIWLDDQTYGELRTVSFYAHRTMSAIVREAIKDKLKTIGRGKEDHADTQ